MHNELYISKYANKTLWMCQTYIIANSNLVKKKKKVFTKSFMSQLTLQFVRIPILQSLLQQFSFAYSKEKYRESIKYDI